MLNQSPVRYWDQELIKNRKCNVLLPSNLLVSILLLSNFTFVEFNFVSFTSVNFTFVKVTYAKFTFITFFFFFWYSQIENVFKSFITAWINIFCLFMTNVFYLKIFNQQRSPNETNLLQFYRFVKKSES